MKSLLAKKEYNKNAHIYKILANATRLEIVHLLAAKELPVEEILKVTKISKANLSQHLALLRHNGLVQTRREGLNIYYKLIDKKIIEPSKILNKLKVSHIIA